MLEKQKVLLEEQDFIQNLIYLGISDFELFSEGFEDTSLSAEEKQVFLFQSELTQYN